MASYGSIDAAVVAAGGAPSPSVLADVGPAASDLVITSSGGLIDNGVFAGWGIDGWANLGDNSGSGGPSDAMKDHAAGYTELSALSVSNQCRLQQNASGVPFPNNGTAGQDGIFLKYPNHLKGDWTLTVSMSHDHPGGSVFTNSGIGLCAKRITDTNNYTADTRIVLRAGYVNGTTYRWIPTMMGTTRTSGSQSSKVTNTTRSWSQMERVGGIIRFRWKANEIDAWTELDSPGLSWDVAGSVCEVGFGWGGHAERNVIRIYDMKIEGIEA